MEKNNNTFDLTDSFLRVFGIIGFFAAVFFGFVVAGGNVITLVHPAEMIIVVGTIFFGLLCTHRSKFLTYLPKALLALIRKPVPNRESVSYTHLRAHETRGNLVCRLLLEKKK